MGWTRERKGEIQGQKDGLRIDWMCTEGVKNNSE